MTEPIVVKYKKLYRPKTSRRWDRCPECGQGRQEYDLRMQRWRFLCGYSQQMETGFQDGVFIISHVMISPCGGKVGP